MNPINSATVDPENLNLAFEFNSNSSFEYSYTLDVSGIPDGGFLLYDDVEGAVSSVPEPATAVLLAVALALLAATLRWGTLKSGTESQQHTKRSLLPSGRSST
jgi:hypothetical protein